MRGRGFKPRPCIICGKIMLSMEEIAFLRPTEARYSNDGVNTDYTGYCKTHDVSDVLYKKNGKYHVRELFRVARRGFLASWFNREV